MIWMSAVGVESAARKGMTRLQEANLWRDLSVENRAQIIEQFQPLVYHVFGRLTYRPQGEQVDLISEGTLGLIEAVDAFDPERGVTFKTFAYLRIKGKMLDYLRRRSWRVRREELAELEQFNRAFPVTTHSAEKALDAIALAQSLLRHLTAGERRIIELLYFKGLTQEEVARKLQCSRPNVSILRKRALRRLRSLLARSDECCGLAFDF